MGASVHLPPGSVTLVVTLLLGSILVGTFLASSLVTDATGCGATAVGVLFSRHRASPI